MKNRIFITIREAAAPSKILLNTESFEVENLDELIRRVLHIMKEEKHHMELEREQHVNTTY